MIPSERVRVIKTFSLFIIIKFCWCRCRCTSLHSVKVIEMQGQLSIAFAFYGRLTGHFVVAKQTVKQTPEM